MDFSEDYAQINQQYKELNDRVYNLYTFVDIYSTFMRTPRDYGSGEKIGLMDVHTLTYIVDNPGVTVTQLALDWKKTKSAVSQTVKRLAGWELITRAKTEYNAKTVLLYPTKKGIECARAHKAHDIEEILATNHELLKSCTQEEINGFYKVISAYVDLFQEDSQ